MSKYKKMKEQQQERFRSFPLVCDYSEAMFEWGMKRLGLEPGDVDQLEQVMTNGFCRKSDVAAFYRMMGDFQAQLYRNMENKDFAVDAFCCELQNHKHDLHKALGALALSKEDVKNNPMLKAALQEAIDITGFRFEN